MTQASDGKLHPQVLVKLEPVCNPRFQVGHQVKVSVQCRHLVAGPSAPTLPRGPVTNPLAGVQQRTAHIPPEVLQVIPVGHHMMVCVARFVVFSAQTDVMAKKRCFLTFLFFWSRSWPSDIALQRVPPSRLCIVTTSPTSPLFTIRTSLIDHLTFYDAQHLVPHGSKAVTDEAGVMEAVNIFV